MKERAMTSQDDDQKRGQVSEVSGLGDADQPISPGDATAGYPTSESGEPDEGAAGPNAREAPADDPDRAREHDDPE
jgi:hypothetical protein